jgi:hypothetical protein
VTTGPRAANLAPGTSTSLGFLASWNDVTNADPAISCTLS